MNLGCSECSTPSLTYNPPVQHDLQKTLQFEKTVLLSEHQPRCPLTKAPHLPSLLSDDPFDFIR